MEEEKEVRKFDFDLDISETLQHNFNGLDEEKKIKSLPEKDQAEKHCYRNPQTKNIAIPNVWIRGSLIGAYIIRAGFKQKTAEKLRVSPRLQIEPMYLDTGQKNYQIDRRSAPSGGRTGGVRDISIRPLIKSCKVKGTLVTTLPESADDIRKMLEFAGSEIGIGSNRVNGFGRFKVTKFTEQK
jgi:hypothetical protein